MDSSVSPTHGAQEGSTYNGHFGCTCYHPVPVPCSTSSAIWNGAPCVPATFSADGWRKVLEPVVARYKERDLRRYFRGDAAFASPDIYSFWKTRASCTRSVCRRTKFFWKASAICSREPRWPSAEPCAGAITPASAIGPKAGIRPPRRRQGGVAPQRAVSPGRVHRHQPVATGRAGDIVLQSAGQSGAMHQGRQERDQMDEAVVSQVPR